MLGMFGMFAPRGGRAPGASLAPAARLVVCAAVPWYACLWLGTTADPVPAALPAVLILREDVFEAPRLALQRLVGVVAGVLLSVAVLHRLPPGSLSFLIVLVCGCAGMYLLRQGGSPNQQVLITAMMIYATAEPGYPLARLEESAVGIAVVALLGPLLWPPNPCRDAAAGLDAYRAGLRVRMERTAALALGGDRTAPGPAAPYALWHRPHELSAALDRRTRRTLLLPPRRPPAGAADTLRPRLLLAARTAPALLFLTRELETRTGGTPAGPDEAVEALAPLIDATASTLDTALRGEDCAAALHHALELERTHRASHPARRDAVLRAGLHLTHEALTDHLVPPTG
ncbi:FUSC family protein [Streptomyces sp. NPDC020858]|uniref:FUSC family protein n=1 Tax=Streptomyces sp. NPDC020858 TaxID=3365097 RepID=UPI0037A92923